jgi:hypothetical protein
MRDRPQFAKRHVSVARTKFQLAGNETAAFVVASVRKYAASFFENEIHIRDRAFIQFSHGDLLGRLKPIDVLCVCFHGKGPGVPPIASHSKALRVACQPFALPIRSHSRPSQANSRELSNWPSEPMTQARYFATALSECLFYLVGLGGLEPGDRSNSLTSYAAST